jgi:hypothetical protein
VSDDITSFLSASKIQDILRVYKFRVYLWISYFFDDITTFFGSEKTWICWGNL